MSKQESGTSRSTVASQVFRGDLHFYHHRWYPTTVIFGVLVSESEVEEHTTGEIITHSYDGKKDVIWTTTGTYRLVNREESLDLLRKSVA